MPATTCPSCRSSYPAELKICPRDGSALESEGWLPRATVAGKYVILRRVSEDEVSVCYAVRVLESGEFRMLRALRSDLSADASALREFRLVGGVLRKIVHPNVLRVETVDRAEDGRPFLVTEFVDTPSLAEWLHDGNPLETERVCGMARGIAAGLEACHRVGLHHLALQPRNILVDGTSEDPHVKVQGFETARVRAARSRDGLPAGNKSVQDLMPAALAYSSPEQALARSPESLDARSDLYSLGVLMYQMLAGRLPFPGPGNGEAGSLASLAARLEEAPAGLEPRDSLPESLIELVMQLLERRPELRPATVRSVSERIALAEGRVAVPIRPVLKFPPPAIEPVAVRASEELPVPAELPPAVAEEPILAPLMPAQALAELEIAVPASEAASVVASAPGPAASGEPYEAPSAAASGNFTAGVPPWTGPDSILFRTEPPAGTANSTRWVWAVAAALVLAVGTAFFVHRGGLKWQGPGPLSPLSSDQVRTMMGQGTTGSTAPATTPSQPEVGQHPAANSAEDAAPPNPATENPPRPTEQPPASQPLTTAGHQRPAGNGMAPAIPANAPQISAGASSSEKSSTTRKQEASPTREEGMAEVNRAVAAGDVFFELGQYDLAVRTYEGPLKLDPNNKLLRSRIDRALKAKAAEQQFLGQ